MKKIHFEVKTDGFYGAYWKNKKEKTFALFSLSVFYIKSKSRTFFYEYPTLCYHLKAVFYVI